METIQCCCHNNRDRGRNNVLLLQFLLLCCCVKLTKPNSDVAALTHHLFANDRKQLGAETLSLSESETN